jgi:hypothetical protein
MRSAPTAAPAAPENALRHHAPIDIGERTLTTRSMCRKRSGLPRSRISRGAHGTTAATVSLRAIAAERASPARSQPTATNDEPLATPPNQKYSGTSHVHTGALMTGPWTSAGTSVPPRMRRAAARTAPRPPPAVRRA